MLRDQDLLLGRGNKPKPASPASRGNKRKHQLRDHHPVLLPNVPTQGRYRVGNAIPLLLYYQEAIANRQFPALPPLHGGFLIVLKPLQSVLVCVGQIQRR